MRVDRVFLLLDFYLTSHLMVDALSTASRDRCCVGGGSRLSQGNVGGKREVERRVEEEKKRGDHFSQRKILKGE